MGRPDVQARARRALHELRRVRCLHPTAVRVQERSGMNLHGHGHCSSDRRHLCGPGARSLGG